MEPPLKRVCSDCLTSVEASSDTHPVRCDRCGGAVETVTLSPSREYETPLSLELTPDEPHWPRPYEGPDRCKSDRRTPETIGRFQVRELLGVGGFGDVFRAHDPRLGRDVALKVLREPRPTARLMERFYREARAAAQLDHPNIAPLLDAGRDAGRCWIAYQFLPGRTLDRVPRPRADDPRSRRDAIESAARITRDLADALDHAHRLGVVHRDIKPSNIILDAAGRPRLIDFGLARRTDLDPTLTVDGAVLGTPAYMSPEQASGNSHTADARSDVYSLGVVLFELLCGRRPPPHSPDAPDWSIESVDSPRSARSLDRSIPATLDRICARALTRDPSGRFPDARSLRDELTAWLDRQERRSGSPLYARFASGLTAATLLGAGAGAWEWARPAPEPGPSHNSALTSPTPSSPRPRISLRFKGEPPRETTTASLFAARGSRFYHRAPCKMLDADPRPRAAIASPDQAKAQGLLACHICRPAS